MVKSISACITPIFLLFFHPVSYSSDTFESVHNPLSLQMPLISGRFCIGYVKRLH